MLPDYDIELQYIKLLLREKLAGFIERNYPELIEKAKIIKQARTKNNNPSL